MLPLLKKSDFLLKTFTIRRKELLKCKRDSEYTSFFLEWPRMLDTPGAIEHDFSQTYPLVAHNLSSKWETLTNKIVTYFSAMKKSVISFGIRDNIDGKYHIAAFFMMAILLRSRSKRMTQADSVKSFVRVINPLEDVDDVAANLAKSSIMIICKGDLEILDFESVIKGMKRPSKHISFNYPYNIPSKSIPIPTTKRFDCGFTWV
ncbi:unnamed protein product [Allacma fusca]|uniref:Uncharacterized protein n=2 Tax=Allacma fusca TaxID=39272 RepID=A0A8J2JXG3_9HEXA|nr:unnamed protein product [Allacma fusca]